MSNNNLPRFGDLIVESGQATLEFHQFLEDMAEVGASQGPTVTTGDGPPTTTPSALGDIYIDFTNDNEYAAVGISSPADWKQTTGAGGGDLLAANNLSDVASAATSRTNLDVDQAGTDNSTNVTLVGSGTYLSIIGQAIQVDPITESDISDLGTYISATGTPTTGDTLVYDGADWTVDMTQLIKYVDDVSGTTFYIGEAQPGELTSAASWRIKRIVFTGDDSATLYADGDVSFDNIWDNRASLSYS